jgi:hypothetical protein
MMDIKIQTKDPFANLSDKTELKALLFEEDEEDREEEPYEYRVRVTRRIEILEECYVYIDARSEEEAAELVENNIYDYCDEWDYAETLDIYDEEVGEVVEQ